MLRHIQNPRIFLMSEAYSKPRQLSKIIKHIENPGKSEYFIQVFSGIFRNIQQYSALFRHIEKY